MSIKVFYLERSNKVQQNLRRYTDDGGECSDINNYGYHNAIVKLGVVEVPDMPEDQYHVLETGTSIVENGMIGPIAENDPRWPTHCTCGYKFPDTVKKQYWPQRLYQRLDTGELHTLRDAPVGAMWHIDYNWHTGPDGQCLVVKIPGGHDWMVDSVASNCDSPCKFCGVPKHSHTKEKCSNPGDGRDWTVGQYEDSKPEHRCWVRHGDARAGTVHVDKNGITCNAGAGSIVGPSQNGQPGWHGFLHNGYLVGC